LVIATDYYKYYYMVIELIKIPARKIGRFQIQILAEIIFFTISYLPIFKMLSLLLSNWRLINLLKLFQFMIAL